MFERGDLLLVPYPFSDLSSTKRRPVVALTAPDEYGDFIALPVTSRQHHEHVLPLVASDLVRGALPAASWIRTDRVVTLHVSLIVKSFGRVGGAVLDVAAARLCDRISRGAKA